MAGGAGDLPKNSYNILSNKKLAYTDHLNRDLILKVEEL